MRSVGADLCTMDLIDLNLFRAQTPDNQYHNQYMMLKKTGIFLFGLLLNGYISKAQTSSIAHLSFELRDLPAGYITMGSYIGGQAFRLDSTLLRTPGQAFYFDKKALKPGLYFLSSGSKRLLDFVVASAADSFLIRGALAQPEVLGSEENQAYFVFEQERKQLEEKILAKTQMLQMVEQATKGQKEAMQPIQSDLEDLYKMGDSLATSFINNYESSLYAQMLRSVRPPIAPDQVQVEGGAALLYWQRVHYFDHTNFQDERLLHNHFWHTFFDGYFAQFVAPQPDSLMQSISEVLAKMPRNGLFYQFAVLRLTRFFEQNEASGADRVFVYLVEKYLPKDRTPWLDLATLERLHYKADAHRPNLTGSLALNFELPDEKGQIHSLYEVQAPVTMLVFYSPLCDHCKEVMPKIYQTHLDYGPKGLKTVAVNTDKQHLYWKKWVGQQSWNWLDLASPEGIEALEKQYSAVNLPVIYVLDRDKRILSKRVSVEQLGAVLSRMPWD